MRLTKIARFVLPLALLSLACTLGASDDGSSEADDSGGGVPISKPTTAPQSDSPSPTEPPPAVPTTAPTEIPQADTPEEPADGPIYLELLGINVIELGGAGFDVVGLVKNVSDFDMRSPNVFFTFYDADGNEVGSDNAVGAMFHLPPGGVTPVKEGFPPEAPAGTEYVHVELGWVAAVESNRWTWDGLEATLAGSTKDEYGNWEVAGVIANAQGVPMDALNVVVVGLDSSGRMVTFARTLLESIHLEPGSTMPFAAVLLPYDQSDAIADFDILVEGRLINQ